MNKFRLQTTWLILLTLGLLNAQSKALKKAHTLYDNMAYVDAKDIYEDLAHQETENVEIYQRLGYLLF